MCWCRKSDAEVPEFPVGTDKPGSGFRSPIQVEPVQTLNNNNVIHHCLIKLLDLDTK